jgi:hypothetical protein
MALILTFATTKEALIADVFTTNAATPRHICAGRRNAKLNPAQGRHQETQDHEKTHRESTWCCSPHLLTGRSGCDQIVVMDKHDPPLCYHPNEINNARLQQDRSQITCCSILDSSAAAERGVANVLRAAQNCPATIAPCARLITAPRSSRRCGRRSRTCA